MHEPVGRVPNASRQPFRWRSGGALPRCRCWCGCCCCGWRHRRPRAPCGHVLESLRAGVGVPRGHRRRAHAGVAGPVHAMRRRSFRAGRRHDLHALPVRNDVRCLSELVHRGHRRLPLRRPAHQRGGLRGDTGPEGGAGVPGKGGAQGCLRRLISFRLAFEALLTADPLQRRARRRHPPGELRPHVTARIDWRPDSAEDPVVEMQQPQVAARVAEQACRRDGHLVQRLSRAAPR